MTSCMVLWYVLGMDTAAYLRQVVTMLAREIGVRSCRDIEQLRKAEAYIASQFASFGYSVTRHPFYFFGNVYYNLIAEAPGTSASKKVLVIGAHYDTVPTTPGADDNASGVAGLLGIARALVGARPSRAVRFVAFALEEPPVYRTESMGSYQYAQSLRMQQENVEGMICLEMIGFFRDEEGSQHYPLPLFKLKYPAKGNYIAMVGNRASKRFTETTARAFRKAVDLPVITLNAPALVVGIDFSDHWSFNKFGYKACMVTDTAFYRNPHYHKPTDLPETLDYTRMAKVVDGLAAAVGRGDAVS